MQYRCLQCNKAAMLLKFILYNISGDNHAGTIAGMVISFSYTIDDEFNY